MENKKVTIDLGEIGKQKIKENLFFTLINREKNEKLLSEIPYVNFLDLAIVFNYLLAKKNGELQSFKVNNKIMEAWGLDTQSLYDMARENMDRLMPEMLTGINSLVQGIRIESDEDAPSDEDAECDIQMYVITNKCAVNGSAAVLYSKRLGELAAGMESDLYVLPSSIHEMIIVPKKYYTDVEMLKMLVKEVNKDKVSPEERLSDNVYCYDWKTGNMYICEEKDE